MAGKFELYTDARSEYRFRLKAGNEEIIATSEGYKPKASASTASSRCRRTHLTRRSTTRPKRGQHSQAMPSPSRSSLGW